MPASFAHDATAEPVLTLWPVHAVGLVHVVAAADADEARLARQLAELLRRHGVADVTVQVTLERKLETGLDC